jgi:hypothetical protein
LPPHSRCATASSIADSSYVAVTVAESLSAAICAIAAARMPEIFAPFSGSTLRKLWTAIALSNADRPSQRSASQPGGVCRIDFAFGRDAGEVGLRQRGRTGASVNQRLLHIGETGVADLESLFHYLFALLKAAAPGRPQATYPYSGFGPRTSQRWPQQAA